ncbi:phosphoribosyltransferase-like protein [Paenibacillus sp. 481]|uniref:phosphoribosyltransferase-like protein n=1 Tax=Paenibacillus sp. 481 TaxID=2835869 RepID=UPI001E406665|nr:hypothetical protein [Paenibacillus sp. 481]UHA74700.1 hypothetical protein KIK04_06400 [Paenibacillus sp. 481]
MLPASELFEIREALRQFIENNNILPEMLVVDKKLRDIEQKLVNWLEPITPSDRRVFLHLFKHFQYFDRLTIIDWFERSYRDYVSLISPTNDSIFVPVCSFGGIMNGAISLFDCMNEADVNISKNIMAVQPRDFYDENVLTKVQNIVLVDDIVGSGDTLIDFMERTQMTCPDFFQGRQIYILPILCLEKGVVNVLKYAEESGLSIKFLDHSVANKVFSDPVIYPDLGHAKEAKKILKPYEERVASQSVYTWGYKRSETLAAFYFNTPNNTLSTFHEKNEVLPWNPVFPRKKNGDSLDVKESSTLHEIKRRKEERRDMRYQLAKSVEEERRKRELND